MTDLFAPCVSRGAAACRAATRCAKAWRKTVACHVLQSPHGTEGRPATRQAAQPGPRVRGRPRAPRDINLPPQRIGIRELRQHASVYVDLVERGYTVDITNRGRLVAQMIPVRDPESPLERWIAKGVIERAEDEGSVLEIDPYPGTSAARGPADREPGARAAAGRRGRGPAVIYLDSSALVKLALTEPETAALTSYLAARGRPGARLELPAPGRGAPRHLAGRAGRAAPRPADDPPGLARLAHP